MQFYPRLSAGLTAFIALITFGTVAASAQTHQEKASQAPTLNQEVPKTDDAAASPQLKPVAPAPSLVVDAATEVPAEAQVVPPPPHIVARAANSIAIPGKGLNATSGYYASAAGTSTPLQVNSGFGYRWGRKHTGIDFQASWGESVGVSMAGTIAFAGVKRGYGNLIIVDHGNGISTYYAHLSAINVEVGQAVNAGQVIGAVGSTGRSTGPHLHYEVRVNGHPVNPTSTISFVENEVYVNGEPFGAEGAPAEAPAVAPAASSKAAPEADGEATRPRRVLASNGVEKRVLIYGKNSLSAY